jgi:hypothetical protein
MSINYETYLCVIFSNFFYRTASINTFSSGLETKCIYMYKTDKSVVVYNLLFICQVEIRNLTGVSANEISSDLLRHTRMFDHTSQSAPPDSFSKHFLVTSVSYVIPLP